MKRLLKIAFTLLLTITFISSCKKDPFLTDEYVYGQEKSYPILDNSAASSLSHLSNCVDEINPERIDIVSRSRSWHIYNSLIEQNPLRAEHGIPYWQAVITFFEENNSHSLNIIPLIDVGADTLKSVLFLEIEGTDYNFLFLRKSRILQYPNISIEFEIKGETVVLSSEDFGNLFNTLDHYIYCSQEGTVKFFHPANCFDFSISFWCKVTKWWWRTFAVGDEADYDLIFSWVPDAGGVWTGYGTTSGTGTGGGAGSVLPPYNDIIQRMKLCEGYDTPYDVDPQSGGNENTIHPDYDFCETWITYRNNCLSTSTVTEDYNAQIEVWAEFMYYHLDLFNYIVQNPENCVSTDEISQVIAFFENHEGSDTEGKAAERLFIDLLSNNMLNVNLDNLSLTNSYFLILNNYESYFPEFDDFTDDYYGENFDPVFLFHLMYTIECSVLKQLNPSWSQEEVSWQAIKNIFKNSYHTVLDFIGLVPALGEFADFFNGVGYIIEGDGVNASLSFAAMVPFGGWTVTGTKYAGIFVKFANKAHDLKIIFKNGVATFGNSSKLRKVLNITDPLKEAHHIIPWAKRENPIVQLAAHADEVPYHMNHPKNGLSLDKYRADLPDGVHANHPHYNDQVEDGLSAIKEKLETEFGDVIENVDPNVISDELFKFQNYLRDLINSNSSVKINALDFIYTP